MVVYKNQPGDLRSNPKTPFSPYWVRRFDSGKGTYFTTNTIVEGIMLLGTDPEFVFVGPDGLVRADLYYPRQVNGASDNPEIGGDGHPQTVELRPPPRESPAEVAKEIRRILLTHHTDVPDNVAWRAGSFCEGKTLGGHIHFGDVPLLDNILVVLDGVLAQIVICLEDELECKQRRASQYGRLTDIREKRWGFEYRTLSSFIVSPEISIGILALAKACVLEELDNGPMSLSRLSGQNLQTLTKINRNKFISGDKSHFLEKLPALWEIVSRYRYWSVQEGRPLWKNVALLRHIATKYPDWHTEEDMLFRWHVRRQTPEAYKKRFQNEKLKQPILPPEGRVNADELMDLLRGIRP